MQGHVIFFLPLLFQIVLPPEGLAKWGTVKGVVAAGRTAIEGATVIVLGSGRGALTDSTGFFLINDIPPGSFVVRVVAKGFSVLETKKVDVRSTDPVDLKLNLRRYTLDSLAAQFDIESETPKLLMIGGFAGSPPNTSDDNDFENEYGVEYSSLGCTREPELGIRDYNHIIFKYLDEKFGEEWRSEVRNDVYGLNNVKR